MRIILVAILFLVLLTGISAAETNDCNYKIEILLNSSIYAPSDFAWKMKATKISGVSTNITSAAKIEDSGGKIIKTYRPWASDPISKQKTSGEYSPNLKEGQYKLTSEISVDCNDIDKSNNIDSENFEVVSALNENKIDLKNTIGELNQQQDAKGKILIAQNQLESSVPVENTPEENKSIIQTMENKVDVKNNSDEVNPTQKPIEYSNEITLLSTDGESARQDSSKQELAYESSNEKSKEIVLYALLGFSVLLNIILIWKR
ncbi:MAG TPA: hypothetical protein VJI52_05520 [Candidatus Nanoarchaeia archaeon]|nr:hypothetical protein [Candidatus Nanoarchaeia archaeon]